MCDSDAILACPSKLAKGRVSVPLIVGSYRYRLGLALAAVCVAPACANVIGLSDYGVGGRSSESDGGQQNSAGNGGDAGASETGGDAGSSTAGAGGAAETGGSSGASGSTSHAGAGAGGGSSGAGGGSAGAGGGSAGAGGGSAGAGGGSAGANGCTKDADCSPSGNVCKPNKCDVATCKQVDVSMANTLMNDDPNVGNGSFENAVDMGNAVGWTNSGADAAVIYDCTGTAVPANGGCIGSAGTTFQDDGNFVAWLGGTTYAAVDQIEHVLTLPTGTTTLSIQADLNAQTQSIAASNKDTFDVLLLDASKIQIGQPIFSSSNATAQTAATKWTSNAINKTVDVSLQAGKKVYLRLRSSVDATLKTDFFVDNVRVVATVCQ